MIHNFPFPPINENATIWRFMDFTKVMSLFETQSLFFCRSDKLDDPFEGSAPQENFIALTKKIGAKSVVDGGSEGRMKSRESIYINCWYMNEDESAAMWKLYTQSNQGIAIRSTILHLRNSFPERYVDDCLFTGEVEYLDYKKETIPEDVVTNRFFYKRKSFEYEAEVRAMLIAGPIGPYTPNEYGILVPAELSVLIDDLYIGPGSPDWFLDLVTNICKRYSIKKAPIRTSLDDEVLF